MRWPLCLAGVHGQGGSGASIRGVAANARVGNECYAPLPAPVYDNRRRSEERLYDVEVTSVRAVLAAPEKRCGMECEPVVA